ncbi:MAG: prepilin-type N-terminal cleavage/methylation domain-containing protein [Burkholderiales bacterium]
MRRAAIRGFSLIEMAVVLFIVVLLLGSLLVPFATQVEQRRMAETQKTMEEIREALIGFAVAHGWLPCPDQMTGANGNDGVEDRTGTGCTEAEGNLPWATLGVGRQDAWGNHFRYRVTPAFADSGTPFSFTTAGTLRVCSVANCAVSAALATDLPAVVVSHGKNGYGAVSANTAPGANATSPAPTSPDELQNTHAPGYVPDAFVSRAATPTGTPAGEFDDLVVWLSPYVLFDRMVAAGRLP